ncbi:efflux RND transporter periplasmic adaptor subunit [Salipiger bermudensis]|nr:efflux RND transporter periplasmic adaptor subunit [Salipiger bermudensis]
MTLENEAVPFTTTVPGRAVAYQQVDIRPRVGGMISEIVYESGRPVAAGDVLFRIEDDTYRADVASAQAAVDLAQASVDAAQETVTRYENLLGTGVTAEDMATARVALKQAEADRSSAEAALEVAELDLARTEITSPISGFATVPSVSVGALVTENQTDALTTVTRLDPIYVDVAESSRRVGEIRNRFDTGALQRGDRLEIDLELETGETYSGEGEMVSPGTTVSTTTGTTEMRLRFDNAERRIMPGQYLRVDITLGTIQAVLVPQGATSRASNGELTAFVAVDGTAEQRVLTDQGSYRNAWVVTEGVAAGESLIVDGLSNLQDGAAVTTVPVTISEDGVVTEAQTGTDEG